MTKKISRFKRHLHYMGLEDNPKVEALGKNEQNEIDSIRPLPLELTEKNGFKIPTWIYPTVVGFAAIILIVFPIGQDDHESGLQFKGHSLVTPILMRGGEKTSFQEKLSLPGDRIGFEVLSSESGTAYLTVEDKKGVSLIDPMNVLESKISLQAGESKAFDFSITLSEENEGEVVTVYICKPGLENLSEEKLSNMFIQCLPSKFILR